MNIPSAGLPALALALAAAPGAAAHAQATQADLYIDVATHAAPGMPGSGALGRLAGAMTGHQASYGQTRHPGMPGRYLDIALHNHRQPGTPARQGIPGGLRLGDSLELLPPDARQAAPPGRDGAHDGTGSGDGGSIRMLHFWGCGESARPGQPLEYTVTMRDGRAVQTGRAVEPRRIAQRGVSASPEFALWPNQSHGRQVPGDASLVGAHHVTGNSLPDPMRFDLAASQDFMPALSLSSQGGSGEALALDWGGVAGARAYFIHATAAGDGVVVLWSSAEDAYAGPELLDYLGDQDISRWTASRTLLDADARSCQVPREVMAAAGQAMPVVQMIAYGNESSIAEPRPANAAGGWRPAWNVRMRNKSTAMLMPGISGMAGDATGQPPEAGDTIKDRARGMLRGILRR